MSTRVSVVIPVWNPGKFIDRCIDSLLAQTMPASEFEVLFMDDGSTDGTEVRLDRLADEHDHFLVHHLENSGWPGKPRNVGIERAVGEYVLFMDNDDALGPEALERQYAIGARNESDIVIGKVISNFRGVPHQVFRTTRERCTVRDAPLFESLTPHKMFRRQFLLDNSIRYPEGKRRLEDQLIMARSYFPAKSVSIVGDYVCYYYLKREDGTNAGSARIEPKGYYGNLREVLDVVEANTDPGEFRDSIQQRFYRGEMLSRISGRAVLNYQPHFRDDLFTEIRQLALEPRFGPGVHTGLPALLRVRSYFVREDRLEDLLTYTERTNEIRGRAHLENLRWHDGALVLSVRASFTYADQPLELVRQDGRLYLPPEIALEAPAEERECTGQPASVLADATIKNRDTSEEFFLPAKFQLHERSTGQRGNADAVQLEWVGEVRLDPTTAFGGQALGRGVWDISIRLAGLGVTREIRLGRDRDVQAERGAKPALLRGTVQPLVAIPYWTKPYGNLSIDIDQHVQTLKSAVSAARIRIVRRWSRGKATLQLSLPVSVFPGGPVNGTLRLIERSTATALECPLTGQSDSAGLTLNAALPSPGAGLVPGTWDVALVLPDAGWTQPVRIGHVVKVARLGPLRAGRSPSSQSVRRRVILAREAVREVAQAVRQARAR